MDIGLICFSCMTAQMEKIIKLMDIEEDEALFIMKDLMSIIADMDISKPAPFTARLFYNRIRELTGIDDPYREIKRLSNDEAMKLSVYTENVSGKNESPLLKALKLAIAGNIIDYGSPGGKEHKDLKEILNDILEMNIDPDNYDLFAKDSSEAENILYICDNAGEIVMDKILIEKIGPEKTVVAVRGGAVLNDVTAEDARHVGLHDIVKVIDTGDDTPGVDLKRASKNFLEHLKLSDMVILKGQGNFETLIDADLSNHIKKGAPLYFLLKVKCEFVADFLDKKIGDIAFIRRES